MARNGRKDGSAAHSVPQAKYDAHHTVLDKTYGALADLRRELSDSRTAIAERAELLRFFADCTDSQRAWLLLEDYFGKLSLARKDFGTHEWWPKLLAAIGQRRLEELALLFLRTRRPLPNELMSYANLERLSQVEQAEQEQSLIDKLERWMFPPTPTHLDAPRAVLRVICAPTPLDAYPALHEMTVQFALSRPRTGEKAKTRSEIIDLTLRATHERELFSPEDWDFIQWLAETYGRLESDEPAWVLGDLELLRWLACWGGSSRLELALNQLPLHFAGQLAELRPQLDSDSSEPAFFHQVALSNDEVIPLERARFFGGRLTLVLVDQTFYLLRRPPPADLLNDWVQKAAVPVRKLSHRFLAQLRRSNSGNGTDWDKICVAHPATPQFIFELADDTVRLRLMARSDRDQSVGQWYGHEWQMTGDSPRPTDKAELLDDPRLEPATQWLRRLDWFTPEPGLWVGDAGENFLSCLAAAWPDRPIGGEYLANPAFQRLFLNPSRLKPQIVVHGSGIDWFSVSAEWEREGLKLSVADLEQLANATSRFVKLPDAGWVELDSEAVQAAHETLADLGVEGLVPLPQRVDLLHATHLDEAALQRLGNCAETKTLRQRIAKFSGIHPTALPAMVRAELRPYQKDGFDFLCHLSQMRLGGILADDMGLGKTLQTLAWLAWLKEQETDRPGPALVICPASVLHNWRREANRFTPFLEVLILESGAARHNLRQKIPQFDLIITNYALLRRDLADLKKFDFRALILDEAQFIKNPAAQVTQSVKELRAQHRLVLTGTPLENRLLDLWSIMDFVQPGYLGSQSDFTQKYEPRDSDPLALNVARRRLSARLRPLLLRRLKHQVARDLPDRIEERLDCELDEGQRRLYLAELRRSREQIFQAVAEKGLAKNKIHVLAALTRLRQICCHPRLVGNDSLSGKTETLFELLEPLLAEGQKVLVFSQFVQMLKLLEQECFQRQIPTHLLTGATKQRHEVVQTFQNDDHAAVFLLSLRAAGTGLNLTRANHVFHFDRWWNPAVENQATDRAFRIGQTKNVQVHKFLCVGTLEEKIDEMIEHKKEVAENVVGTGEGWLTELSTAELKDIFALRKDAVGD
ncbi:MAG: DEAD/DEAH box helicase [Candidatus Omnitrophica bacterium]|nr:DEAD/DEAH box helicase [Candidatus Omnitrophota bacterium]